MRQEQLDILSDVLDTFKSVVENQEQEYKYKVKEGKHEWTEIKNREQHLQAMMEWAIQKLGSMEVE